MVKREKGEAELLYNDEEIRIEDVIEYAME